MAEVKGGRCDRKYSSLKSRCPYCGARRNKNGKHADYENNSTAKLLIGILILVLLIVAVVVLIVSSIKANKPATTTDNNKDTAVVDDVNKDGVNSGEDTTTVDGTAPTDTTTPDSTTQPGDTTTPDTTAPTTTPDDTNKPQVSDVTITCFGSDAGGDVTMSVGEVVDFDEEYSVEPEDAEVKITWSSSDDSVFTVLQTGEVTAVGSGSANLVLDVGGEQATCLIRVG